MFDFILQDILTVGILLGVLALVLVFVFTKPELAKKYALWLIGGVVAVFGAVFLFRRRGSTHVDTDPLKKQEEKLREDLAEIHEEAEKEIREAAEKEEEVKEELEEIQQIDEDEERLRRLSELFNRTRRRGDASD
tara:strand:- start:93828 stop:94232 length:405 start_codon:yes stop_codon:yes gene_type:complete